MDLPNPSAAQRLSQSLAKATYDQKWDFLRPMIERMYIDEGKKLKDIITTIKDEFGFNANEAQYKYQITRKWGLKKSTSTPKKAALCQAIKTRAQMGKSSIITRNGSVAETRNLRRYLKTEARKTMTLHPAADAISASSTMFTSRAGQFGNRIFTHWNMPYGLMKSSANGEANHASPLSDYMVATPPSPHDTPSPMAIAIKEMTKMDKARLLVEGKHSDLLRALEKQERVIMSTWLYQYWLFSFKTAKHWGFGPITWNADILGFERYQQRKMISASSPTTPATSSGTPASQPTPRQDGTIDITSSRHMSHPESLCRWSIHCPDASFVRIPSPPRSPQAEFDLEDEVNWPQWPAPHANVASFTERLGNGLADNSFTNVGLADLPVAVNQIVKAVRKSPEEMREEALCFAIMGRNVELVQDLLEEFEDEYRQVNGLFPFHLAVSYLDGSKTCCNLLVCLELRFPMRQMYINDLGHTVLDNLMIAILKAHTSCKPKEVDIIFARDKRFEGEDVDICGRWDPDSNCIRTLLADGNSQIPFQWKHCFCHTSVQTICHCIGTLFGGYSGPDVNTASGLFVRRCSHCGLKMQLLPLHTLLIISFHLSQSGCEGETLFGVVACVLCLLHNGANPTLKADISLRMILSGEESLECSHHELDPVELIETLPASLASKWPKEIQTAWQVLHSILQHSQGEWIGKPRLRNPTSDILPQSDDFSAFVNFGEDEMDTDDSSSQEFCFPEDCSCGDDFNTPKNFFGTSSILATLWAAVQTELLIYRRLKEGDAWLSKNFDMETLKEGLDRGVVTIPLVSQRMMKEFCECGEFLKAIPACAVVEDVSAYYFANLEDWSRSTFIESPEYRKQGW